MSSRWLSGHETVTRYLSAIDALLSPVTPGRAGSEEEEEGGWIDWPIGLDSKSRALSFVFT